MKITYQFVEGENATIEVSKKWGKILLKLDKEENKNNHHETRKHVHFEAMHYEGEVFAIEDSFIEQFFVGPTKMDILGEALKTLNPRQQELIEALFVEGMTQEEYARKKGVSQSAIAHQFQTISKKIKKFF